MKRDFDSVLYKNIGHVFSASCTITAGYQAMKGDYREAFSWLAAGDLIEMGDYIYKKLENRRDNGRNSDGLDWVSRGAHMDRGIERCEGIYDQDGVKHTSDPDGRKFTRGVGIPYDLEGFPARELGTRITHNEDHLAKKMIDDLFK